MKAEGSESRNLFRNLSPLDHRYYLEIRELFDRLSDFLSEEAVVRYYARVEVALLAELLLMLPESVLPESAGSCDVGDF